MDKKDNIGVIVNAEDMEQVQDSLRNKRSLKRIVTESAAFGTLLGLGSAFLIDQGLYHVNDDIKNWYPIALGATYGASMMLVSGISEVISRSRTIGKINYRNQ